MAKDWIKKATKNKGALHRKLGVPAGKDIPKGKLAKADKKAKKNHDVKEERQIALAKTLGKIRKK